MTVTKKEIGELCKQEIYTTISDIPNPKAQLVTLPNIQGMNRFSTRINCLEEALNDHGIEVIRPDMRIDDTITERAEKARRVHEFAYKRAKRKSEETSRDFKTGNYASSLGALVDWMALNMARETSEVPSDYPSAAAYLNPVGEWDEIARHLLDQHPDENLTAWKEKGSVRFTFKDGFRLDIPYSMYEDAEGIDACREAYRQSGHPILVIVSGEDEIIPEEVTEKVVPNLLYDSETRREYPGTRRIDIPDADHGCTSETSSNTVLRELVSYLTEHLIGNPIYMDEQEAAKYVV